MPVFANPGGTHGGNQCYREKLEGQKEINNTPAVQAALDKEWNNLINQGAWNYSIVREWDDVSKEAIKNKTN